ncbi:MULTISPECIES: ATP-binding cassette domain-containing protein [unclassified Clostridioides]|uniref:ABC transporter ATP-binding protein n=1 Tax=unclassified Clostridioides TaxID=2635829 RepID=UPI001D119AD5|nr:ABC transporter ATP-binding protein [Clostridioides sp. ZZV14-6150]MCC0659730.1 ABC transporter ATP-binding protein [Clostridioides sp. ZZV14-6154]MCC0666755.1 ABC transporter ATP-binding protein [Clostridioides sp. ZZV14-6153]MCC0717777.1 ABC transporter ATP-binding protein [Clostridioides sp. ZZV14-6105]MCC0722876.1 ABC transporter ATP-binding protein [Clostridioides sp. ZZV14-6104]MCC0728187.1 ABC transporter ATP-binding protein [Clostridioides sp. ZZV14-6045]MCC0729217.1 ABC transporte
MDIVKVNNITKRFNDKLALDNISFSVKKGEIFGLIGPNGAGKSTLINIITNLTLPNSGNIQINGVDLSANPMSAKSIIGLVPQELAVMETLTPFDNLEYFGAFYGLKGKLLQERINEALEVTGLAEVKKKKVKKLSGGMQRRLNIGIALLNHPKILILDEPTVGVDPQSRNHIFNFIKDISEKQKTTIIYTSHYMEEVEHLCSKIFIMDEGKEVAFGDNNYLKSIVSTNTKLIMEIKNINAQLIFDLKNIKGVISVLENTSVITLDVDKNFQLTDVLSAVDKNNSKVIRISYEEPSLEDVFLNLTGKNLRD